MNNYVRLLREYPLYREYPEDMEMIESRCRDSAVVPAGRYGRWVYSAMEDAVLDGMRAADEVRELCAAQG